MSGQMTNSPAEVIHQWLLNEALIEGPTGTTWPGFVNNADERKSDMVVVLDTAGRIQGKTHASGETQEHYGIQLQVASESQADGYSKISEIFAEVDALARASVTISGSTFIVDAITPTSTIIRIGKEQPEDYLYLFTANFVVSIKQTIGV